MSTRAFGGGLEVRLTPEDRHVLEARLRAPTSQRRDVLAPAMPLLTHARSKMGAVRRLELKLRFNASPTGSWTRSWAHIDAFRDPYNATAVPFTWTKAEVHQRSFKGRRISEV